MSFINEKIPEEDYEKFNAIGLKNPVNNHAIRPYMWTIDRGEYVFFIRLGSLEPHAKIEYYALVVDKKIITIQVSIKKERDSTEEKNHVTWNVIRIDFSADIGISYKQIKLLIEEAICAHGVLCSHKFVKSLNVKFN